jgi:hypothetical protein
MDPQFIDASFTAADVDKDGAVSGGEAVKFFGRSGLPTAVLRQASVQTQLRTGAHAQHYQFLFKGFEGRRRKVCLYDGIIKAMLVHLEEDCLPCVYLVIQVWEMASGGTPKLNKPQFVNALRLVSLAQVRARRPAHSWFERAQLHALEPQSFLGIADASIGILDGYKFEGTSSRLMGVFTNTAVRLVGRVHQHWDWKCASSSYCTSRDMASPGNAATFLCVLRRAPCYGLHYAHVRTQHAQCRKETLIFDLNSFQGGAVSEA